MADASKVSSDADCGLLQLLVASYTATTMAKKEVETRLWVVRPLTS